MRNLFPAQSFAGWYENLTNQLGHRWLGQFVGLILITAGHAVWPSPILPLVAMSNGEIVRTVMSPAREAGDRYSIRYEQLNMFLVAAA